MQYRFWIGVVVTISVLSACVSKQTQPSYEKAWIRTNLLGYTPEGIKVAVWAGKQAMVSDQWWLVNSETGKKEFHGKKTDAFGAYGPFTHSYRLNFSNFKKEGKYYIQSGNIRSEEFTIGKDVYKGAADFALRYMRQQRTLFNPYLKDSCHTADGYVLYGSQAGIADSSYVDAAGGWHDASDYLQYSTTSANATWHLLAAYRDFPGVFDDSKQANGLEGKNGIADVLDEAKWGLDWLLKMHPRADWMFNQIADDRDHISMRRPGLDSMYGRGHQRPVYFIDGKPQQRGKFMNNTTGTSSTAAKFVSAFSLGAKMFENDISYKQLLESKAQTAIVFSLKRPGVTQTVSVKSPYIYAEDNWVDDMELAYASLASLHEDSEKVSYFLKRSQDFAHLEPVTPWMQRDTANHYQYYPFINLGHYELAKQLKGEDQKKIVSYYKQGMDAVWARASKNAFYRGVPFIWCSNNLTTSFAIQCNWYQELTGSSEYAELAQANFDWLFGVNPWGTSMVYGLPANADTPDDPHSAFTKIMNFPIDGGLIDGPVYTSIYSNLIGITLTKPDAYAEFQSDLAVYHDDYGDYSTNEPTMDGTASLIYLLAMMESRK